MISQLFTQDTFKVMTLFALSPGSRFNRKEVKEKTFLNNVPLDKALARMISSEMVNKEGNYYSINFGNDCSEKLVQLCSKQHKQLKKLPLKVYFLLIDLVQYFSTLKNVEMYLFGSYSKLIFSEKSDIDIAVLQKKAVDNKVIGKLTKKLERTYGKQLQIHYFDRKSFYKNRKDPLVKEIIKNGVKLI